jgi:hydrogenase maturation protease
MNTRAKLAVIGIGNPLAGDDAAGVEVVRRLQVKWSGQDQILFHILEGDLLEISEWLDRADRFLFVDAVAGQHPGTLRFAVEGGRAFAPSFHQTDIATAMRQFEALGLADPFPPWEVWGVVIDLPGEVREGLSPAVAAGVAELAHRVSAWIESHLSISPPNRSLSHQPDHQPVLPPDHSPD